MYQNIGNSMRTLDGFLEEMIQSINVDIMPGDQDPADEALPQQPMNRAYFSKSYPHNQLNAVSNPYEFSIDETLILGTSGKYS